MRQVALLGWPLVACRRQPGLAWPGRPSSRLLADSDHWPPLIAGKQDDEARRDVISALGES